jgi:uncharacterized protein (DUF433 family)
LQRLSTHDLEQTESILNTLWAQYPGLYDQMALSALDQRRLSVEDCAKRLGLAEEECVERLKLYRQSVPSEAPVDVIQEPGQATRVASGTVAVWEIVREFRKIGSLEALVESFPSLTTGELAAAIAYARQHPDEIEDMINRYEEALARRRNAYPFAVRI